MKKLILLELALLFLATTFQSDNPPGWYQQQLPVNDFINDIFFLDSLNGWVVTYSQGGSDTGYILKTTDAGNNWTINLKAFINFNVIQFLNNGIGFAGGGDGRGKFLNTIDGGNNWNIIDLGSGLNQINDLQFVNKDTGWICSDNLFAGGVFKTTNGGGNWVRQLDQTYSPKKLFFVNEHIGWTISNDANGKIFKTTNAGTNWLLQTTFGTALNDVSFINKDTGFVSANKIYKTINGGNNWIASQSSETGIELDFVSDSIGWASQIGFIITKTTNAGTTWFNQQTPIFNNLSVSASDNLKAWAGGSGIIHTTDGGGLSTIIFNGNSIPEKFILYQNYPNPFNPNTIINYELRITSYVILKVFDVQGKEVVELVNIRQSPGEYKVDFNGDGLTSGVYFYKIDIIDVNSNKVTETKKMILIR